MKKKMMLVNYTFTTGEEKFSHSQIVSLRFEKNPGLESEKKAAIAALIAWFENTYPESYLESVVPWPTIYADIHMAHIHPIDVPVGWFNNESKPFPGNAFDPNDGIISDEVLIDLDGKRENFVVGCWHFSHGKLEGWWRVPEFHESSLDEKNMRWSYLPLAKYLDGLEKIWREHKDEHGNIKQP